LQIAHHTDDGLGDAVAFLIVFDGYGVIDHFLKMPTVFGNDEMGPFGIVL
jgi:hypothetical protein